jgi:hypothetical protein
MFGNNIVINNIYNKLNEIEELTLKYNQKRKAFYATIIVAILAISFFIYKFDLAYFPFLSLFDATTIVFCFFAISRITLGKNDPFSWLSKHPIKLNLIEVKEELSDYMSKKHVRKELLYFLDISPKIDDIKAYLNESKYLNLFPIIHEILNEILKYEMKISDNVIPIQQAAKTHLKLVKF